MQQDVCFSRIARPADQHPENISGHAGISLLVVACGRKFGIVIWNFHFLIYTPNKHVREEVASARRKKKGELEEQEQQICQQFKTNKINKQFSQLSGEELFQPITKRLDKAATKDPEPAEEEELDYGMDELDRVNPFDEDFRPDHETPPPPTPAPTPPPEEDDAASPPPEEKRKTWETPKAISFLQKSSESVDLQTVNQLITKYGNDPNYRVKSKTFKFHGYSVNDLKKFRDEILIRRGQLQEATLSPLDATSWEMEGGGVGPSDGDKLIIKL